MTFSVNNPEGETCLDLFHFAPITIMVMNHHLIDDKKCKVIAVHAMRAQKAVEVYLHSFFTFTAIRS